MRDNKPGTLLVFTRGCGEKIVAKNWLLLCARPQPGPPWPAALEGCVRACALLRVGCL